MEEETDVAHREVGDGGDFLVAETLLEFQAYDLLLAGGEPRQQCENLLAGLAGFGLRRGCWVCGDEALGLAFGETAHAALLADDIERGVAADGEEPFGDVAVDRGAGLVAEFDERVLHDVACAVVVAEQVDDIAEQRPLVLADGLAHEGVVFIGGRAHAGVRLKCGKWGSLQGRRARRSFLRRKENEAKGILSALAEHATASGRASEDEVLDCFGLVHMNGRIYDPLLGRFLSADLVVQNPASLQCFNRYSYVLNNPLTLTDPSGFAGVPANCAPLVGMVGRGGGVLLNPQLGEALAAGKEHGIEPQQLIPRAADQEFSRQTDEMAAQYVDAMTVCAAPALIEASGPIAFSFRSMLLGSALGGLTGGGYSYVKSGGDPKETGSGVVSGMVSGALTAGLSAESKAGRALIGAVAGAAGGTARQLTLNGGSLGQLDSASIEWSAVVGGAVNTSIGGSISDLRSAVNVSNAQIESATITHVANVANSILTQDLAPAVTTPIANQVVSTAAVAIAANSATSGVTAAAFTALEAASQTLENALNDEITDARKKF